MVKIQDGEYKVIREYKGECSTVETMRRIIRVHLETDTLDLIKKECSNHEVKNYDKKKHGK